ATGPIRSRILNGPMYRGLSFPRFPKGMTPFRGSSLESIVSILMPIAKRRSFKSYVGKLTLAVAAYFVWQEHNFRLFKNSKRSIQEVVDCVMSSVCLKLLSCRFKKSKDAVLFSRLWELLLSMLK
nr:hypothetical protein [Tanacetum cinerariifolium]